MKLWFVYIWDFRGIDNNSVLVGVFNTKKEADKVKWNPKWDDIFNINTDEYKTIDVIEKEINTLWV